MMTMKQAFILIALFGTPSLVFARGGDISGGGQGIVCRNDDGKVASARLLDLAEAEEYFLLRLPTPSNGLSYLSIAENFAAKLDESMPSNFPTDNFTDRVNNIITRVSYDVSGTMLLNRKEGNRTLHDAVDRINAEKLLIPGDDYSIPPVGDSHPLVRPTHKGCNIEQIAVYTDGNETVHFVGGIWRHLDPLNKAALLIHEALYRSLRTMGETTSDRTRKTVAYLFGGMKFEWILQGMPQKYLSCWTSDAENSFRFVVYPADGNFVTAQFLVYNGEVMLTKTAIRLDGAPFAKALGLNAFAGENTILMNKISNPLLNLPYYAYGIRKDEGTGAVTGTIEAFAGTAGMNSLPISCKDQLSEIDYGADGSISVGPAR